MCLCVSCVWCLRWSQQWAGSHWSAQVWANLTCRRAGTLCRAAVGGPQWPGGKSRQGQRLGTEGGNEETKAESWECPWFKRSLQPGAATPDGRALAGPSLSSPHGPPTCGAWLTPLELGCWGREALGGAAPTQAGKVCPGRTLPPASARSHREVEEPLPSGTSPFPSTAAPPSSCMAHARPESAQLIGWTSSARAGPCQSTHNGACAGLPSLTWPPAQQAPAPCLPARPASCCHALQEDSACPSVSGFFPQQDLFELPLLPRAQVPFLATVLVCRCHAPLPTDRAALSFAVVDDAAPDIGHPGLLETLFLSLPCVHPGAGLWGHVAILI